MPRTSYALGALFAVFICLLWWYLPWVVAGRVGMPEKANEVGDAFGSVNALFSGLAFIGVVVALVVQRASSYQDAFEARFFRLTDSLREVVSSFRIARHVKPDATGKDVFELLLEEIVDQIETRKRYPAQAAEIVATIADELRIDLEKFSAQEVPIQIYYDVFHSREDELGPYFRMLYHALRFVDRSNVEKKEDYTDLIRAELSAAETVLLALNCLTEYGEGSMKNLIVKYGLLKHMPKGSKCLPREWFVERIDRRAFEMPCNCQEQR